jgi:transcriptional regulator with XRE-family HTH domain
MIPHFSGDADGPPKTGGADPDTDLVGIVGENLRRLRTRRGLSLDRLAKASGVSRAMLGQIELGRSAPTINLLWKIARALEVPFSAFISQTPAAGTQVLRRADSKVLLSQDGRFSSRALFPFDAPRKVEFYELQLGSRSVAESDAHPPGTTENLVVQRGRMEVVVHGRVHVLEAGDAIFFEADAHHVYRNTSPEEVRCFLVMTYVESVG